MVEAAGPRVVGRWEASGLRPTNAHRPAATSLGRRPYCSEPMTMGWPRRMHRRPSSSHRWVRRCAGQLVTHQADRCPPAASPGAGSCGPGSRPPSRRHSHPTMHPTPRPRSGPGKRREDANGRQVWSSAFVSTTPGWTPVGRPARRRPGSAARPAVSARPPRRSSSSTSATMRLAGIRMALPSACWGGALRRGDVAQQHDMAGSMPREPGAPSTGWTSESPAGPAARRLPGPAGGPPRTGRTGRHGRQGGLNVVLGVTP
jgi:hypothetical protein